MTTTDTIGIHNQNLEQSINRLHRAGSYKDQSTVILLATRGVVPMKAVISWMGLMMPMNQKIFRIPIEGREVGVAYSEGFEMIVNHPELSKWKYVLTIEEDNLPPPDGLLKLYESIEGGVDGVKYDVVGGLYWTKGEGGQPMIYGNVWSMPKDFIPQAPELDTVMPCNGLGMGFNLFRMSMFKHSDLPKPWFKTLQEYKPGVGASTYTQDLYFYENAGRLGFKFACDTRVRVGHLDVSTGVVW